MFGVENIYKNQKEKINVKEECSHQLYPVRLWENS